MSQNLADIPNIVHCVSVSVYVCMYVCVSERQTRSPKAKYIQREATGCHVVGNGVDAI